MYENRDIETGIEVGLYNQRGTTLRGIYEGGSQESEIAKKYKEQADKIQNTWPRTAAMLRRISESYGRDAVKWDHRVELRDY